MVGLKLTLLALPPSMDRVCRGECSACFCLLRACSRSTSCIWERALFGMSRNGSLLECLGVGLFWNVWERVLFGRFGNESFLECLEMGPFWNAWEQILFRTSGNRSFGMSGNGSFLEHLVMGPHSFFSNVDHILLPLLT